MKIDFPDKSYIEIVPSEQNHKIMITIVARDGENPLTTIANSVELTKEQFDSLIVLDK
jgi:hypothetical protein